MVRGAGLTGEQFVGGLALGFAEAEVLGGGHGLGGGGRRQALERGQRDRVCAIGDELVAAALDALEGVERAGDLGRFDPGLEFNQREGVDVAEVERGEVGVEEVAEERGGVGGRGLGVGGGAKRVLCLGGRGGR